MNKSVVLLPRLSEKTYMLAQSGNTYVFDVSMHANKDQIKQAVSKQFKVAVESVNIQVKKGKLKSSPRKRLAPVKGREASTKRAYVKLTKGDKIPLFEDA
jgi:large subunit ribosomal protein L23